MVGKTPSQLLDILHQVYGDNMLYAHVFEWHKRFKEEHREMKDSYKGGKPLTSRTEVNIGKVGGVWQSSVDCLNDSKSVGHERGLVFGRISTKIGYVWKVTGLGELSILQFLFLRNILALKQPHYLPNLPLGDFFFFLLLKGIIKGFIKGVIKGTCFEDVEVIKRAKMMELRGIPEEPFQQCIQARQRRIISIFLLWSLTNLIIYIYIYMYIW